jgi:selenocysteine lyase/cysteine desulfurase
VLSELSVSVRTALGTYANVHRGSGHNSVVSTYLYEQARGIVLDYLGLDRGRHTVIFCSPWQAGQLRAWLGHEGCHILSSQDVGLPLGLRVIAVPRRALPAGVPLQPGGGTARLTAPGWVVWAGTPDRFEAGTPAIVNVIAFARALQLGSDGLGDPVVAARSATDILRHDQWENLSGQQLLAELRKNLIGRRALVPTLSGPRPFVNLDNAASTPTFEPVWEAVQDAWRQPEPGRQEIVREVKLICAEALNAPPTDYEVVFTSNTTEAINLAAENLERQAEPGTRPVIVNTIMEHNSNDLPWRTREGIGLVRLPVDPEGFLDPTELETVLREHNEQHRHGAERIRLVAVCGASNVLGACNDLAEISRITHRHGARLLVDGAQLVAHRTVDLAAYGIDYFVFSAHKVYAPFGTGALIVRKGLLSFDATDREAIRSSGEENVGGIAALGKALVLLQRVGLEVIQQEEQALTAQALCRLAEIPGLTVFGVRTPESPRFARRSGVIIFTLRGKVATQVARELAEQGGIGVRSGCHCTHMMIKRLLGTSKLLEEFQRLLVTLFPRLSLPGVTRVSLGVENTPEDIDALLDVLGRISLRPAAPGNPFRRRKASFRKELEAFTRATADQIYA